MSSVDDLIRELELDNLEMEEGLALSKAGSLASSPFFGDSLSVPVSGSPAVRNPPSIDTPDTMNPSLAAMRESKSISPRSASFDRSLNSGNTDGTRGSSGDDGSHTRKHHTKEPSKKGEKRLSIRNSLQKKEENGKHSNKKDSRRSSSHKEDNKSGASPSEGKSSHAFDMDNDDVAEMYHSANDRHSPSSAPQELANRSNPPNVSLAPCTGFSTTTQTASNSFGSSSSSVPTGTHETILSSSTLQRFTVPFPSNSVLSSSMGNDFSAGGTQSRDERERGSNGVSRSSPSHGRNMEKCTVVETNSRSILFRCSNSCVVTSVTKEDLPDVSLDSLLKISSPPSFLSTLREPMKLPSHADIMCRKGAFYAGLQDTVGNGAYDSHGDPKEKGGCPFIKCLKCQCMVVRLKGVEWNDKNGTVNLYLTVRNYFPDWSQLAVSTPVGVENMTDLSASDSAEHTTSGHQKGGVERTTNRVLIENLQAAAYCCQCSWLTVLGEKERIATALLDAAAYRQQEFTTHPFATRLPLLKGETRRLPLWCCEGHLCPEGMH